MKLPHFLCTILQYCVRHCSVAGVALIDRNRCQEKMVAATCGSWIFHCCTVDWADGTFCTVALMLLLGGVQCQILLPVQMSDVALLHCWPKQMLDVALFHCCRLLPLEWFSKRGNHTSAFGYLLLGQVYFSNFSLQNIWNFKKKSVFYVPSNDD